VADETRVCRVIARVEGFIDQLSIAYAGQSVRKAQPLLGLYSLNLISLQQQFLNATPSDGRRFVPPPSQRDATSGDTLQRGEDTQRQRLKYWNFSDEQIDRIQKSGKAENSLVLSAPANGVVTEKNVILGQKVFPGDVLLVITDLSTVWAQADVSEMNVPAIKTGMSMEIRLASMPGDVFKGRVKYFQPLLDPQTHTMKVVLEVPNPGLALKPGMLGTVELAADTRRCLTVPEDAVMRTGRGSYVFVQEGELLVPRTVVIGPRCDGCFEVMSGLKAGEKVATSANFLLDSESSLKALLQAAARK
jgi:multidrug efflux pump subunit AcrA (membrane-fusion protein)